MSLQTEKEFEFIGYCKYCGARMYSNGYSCRSDAPPGFCNCECEDEEDYG